MSIAPLHVIGRDMGIDDKPGNLSWSPSAYSLSVGTFILIAGRVGDLYGHKKTVIAGWVWYGFWSLVGGE
jgi:MFS family permease